MTTDVSEKFYLITALRKIMSEKELVDLVIRYVKRSPDANDFSKRVIIHLIGKSSNLKDNVWIRIEDPTLARKVADSVHNMNSSGGSTLIYYFMQALGFQKHLWFLFGEGMGSVKIGISDERYQSLEESGILYDRKKIERIQI